jgi:hypothetical protein
LCESSGSWVTAESRSLSRQRHESGKALSCNHKQMRHQCCKRQITSAGQTKNSDVVIATSHPLVSFFANGGTRYLGHDVAGTAITASRVDPAPASRPLLPRRTVALVNSTATRGLLQNVQRHPAKHGYRCPFLEATWGSMEVWGEHRSQASNKEKPMQSELTCLPLYRPQCGELSTPKERFLECVTMPGLQWMGAGFSKQHVF